jgi:hypothetical protein
MALYRFRRMGMALRPTPSTPFLITTMKGRNAIPPLSFQGANCALPNLIALTS